ncbi:MAG: hypothetical protein IPM82_29840 [Saprospiraceae bacterium]|nr:hypothetical protein [Saprospiraceae bacterium]
MKTFSFKLLVAIFATVIALASCQKDNETALDSHEGQPQANVQNDNPNAVTDRANCEQSITIPANSVDALAAAIANICTGVPSGWHLACTPRTQAWLSGKK